MGGEIPVRLVARREHSGGKDPPATTSVNSCFCWQTVPQGIVHSWPSCNCTVPAVNNTHVEDGRICELRVPSPVLGVTSCLVFGVLWEVCLSFLQLICTKCM